MNVTTLAAGSLIIPQPLKANTEKTKLAIPGTGWWGTDILLESVMPTGRFHIVGLCDVDTEALHNAGSSNTFEEAEKTTSTVIYGDMAFRTNSYLAVDTVEASLLKREYRKPYKHPYSM